MPRPPSTHAHIERCCVWRGHPSKYMWILRLRRKHATPRQQRVHDDLLHDEALGVIERVPYGELVTLCHRMVVTRKHDGSPRRNVDLSPLNKFCRRETFASESPFHLARRIPKGTWKTVTYAWNCYHSVPLRESDRHLTTFITPFGRWRYMRAPQDFLSSGDGYSHRFDAVLSDFKRKERCVDDTVHYDTNLEQHWWRTIDFLKRVGRSGIVLNPDCLPRGTSILLASGCRTLPLNRSPSTWMLSGIHNGSIQAVSCLNWRRPSSCPSLKPAVARCHR